MNQLFTGILAQFFIKLKSFSAMAWVVLVILVGLISALFTNAMGFDYPQALTDWVAHWSPWVLPALVVVQEAIKQAKNYLISESLGQSETGQRSLFADSEPKSDALSKALRL